jgi:hypothetical protein
MGGNGSAESPARTVYTAHSGAARGDLGSASFTYGWPIAWVATAWPMKPASTSTVARYGSAWTACVGPVGVYGGGGVALSSSDAKTASALVEPSSLMNSTR